MNTVECAKCGHLNPHDASKCAECDHHLYVVCPSCGQRIPRIQRGGHRLLEHGLPELEADAKPTSARRRDLKVALVIFAVIGFVLAGALVWVTTGPLRKEFEEGGGVVNIFGRDVGESGLLKAALMIVLLLCGGLVLVLELILGRQNSSAPAGTKRR